LVELLQRGVGNVHSCSLSENAYPAHVRAVQFDMVDPSFPAALVDLAEPALPNDEWARIAVSVGGICGSDLHLFTHNTGPSPTLMGMAGAFPFVLGHEIAGRVIEAGSNCPFAVGTRVALDPCIPCAARGIDPPCANCARGWTSDCLALDSRVTTGGRSLGYTQNLGGGWADQVLAHRTMVHPLPDAIPDRAASLHEPVSIACHGILRAPPHDGEPALIVGAGIIGLASLAALKGLFPACPVTVLARHEHQADAARACGADHVVHADTAAARYEELARLSEARVVGRKHDLMLMGGFPYVIEAVGAPQSVTEALRAVAHRGTVLLLGAAGVSEVDLTPIWYKEAALIGAIDHTIDHGDAPGLAGGADRHSVDRALDILAAGLLPDDVVVTHEFGLDDYHEAITTAIDRGGAHAIKVVFRP
jgi:threonine dehydrogenase-like Zn-dependent dehydrogenase